MILFVNACVREDSRTKRIADHLLSTATEPICELRLADMRFPTMDEQFIRRRDRLIAEKNFEDPLFAPARQFAGADIIVIAAPYWDLSFPALLKQYFEQITVVGLAFRYTPEGALQGLCRAKKLYYVTTMGGVYGSEEYGFGYVKALAQNFYGIPQVEQIKASGLDIAGADVEQILQDCMASMPQIDTAKEDGPRA